MLFGNVAAVVCTAIAIAALIWMFKIEHPRGERDCKNDQSPTTNTNDRKKEV